MLALAIGASLPQTEASLLPQRDFALNSQIFLLSVFSAHPRGTVKPTTTCTQGQTVSVWKATFCFKLLEPLWKTVPSTLVLMWEMLCSLRCFGLTFFAPNARNASVIVSSGSQNTQINTVTADSKTATQRASS